jgi:hypothetical protein
LTVPFQATVKSLSSSFEHHLDAVGVEWLPPLIEMTSLGKIWPAPRRIPGKGERWLREELDLAIDKLTTNATQGAAELL